METPVAFVVAAMKVGAAGVSPSRLRAGQSLDHSCRRYPRGCCARHRSQGVTLIGGGEKEMPATSG